MVRLPPSPNLATQFDSLLNSPAPRILLGLMHKAFEKFAISFDNIFYFVDEFMK
jgi:hypothetical protein